MRTRISSVVGCMFAAAMLAQEPSLKMWAAFVALIFIYAGHEITDHTAKREAKRKIEASAQEISDFIMRESALREENARQQEVIEEFHTRDEEERQRILSDVQETCRKISDGESL